MKKIFLTTLFSSLIFLSSHLPASAYSFECYSKLLKLDNDNHKDSIAYYLSIDEMDEGFREAKDLKQAQLSVLKLAEKLGCKKEDVLEKSGNHKETCHQFAGNARQNICVVEREIGFFIFSRDYVDGINLIFNRWD